MSIVKINAITVPRDRFAEFEQRFPGLLDLVLRSDDGTWSDGRVEGPDHTVVGKARGCGVPPQGATQHHASPDNGAAEPGPRPGEGLTSIN